MKKLTFNKKSAALVLAGVMLVGGVAGGTLAWLTDKSGTVENTFHTSNIGVGLEETRRDYQMIPGWTIEKDPVAYVETGSEDCYLFIKVEESSEKITVGTEEHTFEDFLGYSIDSQWTELEKDKDGNDISGVYYMVIDADAKKGKEKKYHILGEGSYTDTEGVEYSWGDDQVLTKPEVTKEMMDAVTTNQPKLTFTAYAVQLWKSNKPINMDDADAVENAKFTAAEAWAKVES